MNFDELVGQSFRLLREKWASPTALAQELYAMMAPTVGGRRPEEAAPQMSARSEVAGKRLEDAASRDSGPRNFVVPTPMANKKPAKASDFIKWTRRDFSAPNPVRVEPSREPDPMPTQQPRRATPPELPGAMPAKPRPIEDRRELPGRVETPEGRRAVPDLPDGFAATRRASSPDSRGFALREPQRSTDGEPGRQSASPEAPSGPALSGVLPPASPPARRRTPGDSGTTAAPGPTPCEAPKWRFAETDGPGSPTPRVRRQPAPAPINPGNIRVERPSPDSLGDMPGIARPSSPTGRLINPDPNLDPVTREDAGTFRPAIDHDAFAQRHYELRMPFPDWDSPRPTLGGDAATILMGKVVSKIEGGPPGKYGVQLYSSGPNGDPDEDGPIEVLIPTLDPDETLPTGMWLFGISQVGRSSGGKSVTEYWAQPPVWMD